VPLGLDTAYSRWKRKKGKDFSSHLQRVLVIKKKKKRKKEKEKDSFAIVICIENRYKSA